MLTRRTLVGAGLAFAASACAGGFGACGSTAQRKPDARPIDALLIDETIETPPQMAAFIESAARTLPVVGLQLDAAAYAKLIGVLGKSRAIVGISSGATLFCLERMAWDHGFRLTQRTDHCAGDACLEDVAAILSGARALAASPLILVRTYRPSRADGMLHAWVMQKSASLPIRQGRREV